MPRHRFFSRPPRRGPALVAAALLAAAVLCCARPGPAAASAGAPAPSFDCARARSAYQKAVCADPAAARRDVELAAAHARALGAMAGRKSARDLLAAWRRAFLAGDDIALDFRMDRRLALLQSVDSRPRRSLTGRWASESGAVTFRPDLDRPGELTVEIDQTHGTPPSFNICAWQGSGVRENARSAVATAAGEGWQVAFERDGPILRVRDLSASARGAPDPMPYCSQANALGGAFIAVADDTTADEVAAVSFPAPRGASAATIGELLPLLPVSIFDDTTDGLVEDDLKRLIATGESEDWRLERLSDRLARFRAKHPSSEVTLRLKRFGARDLVDVAIRNEKAAARLFLARKGESGPLERFEMRQALRVLLEIEEADEGWPRAAIPEPLADWADKADDCARLAREEGASAAQAARTREAMGALGCAKLTTRAARLARIYAGRKRWTDYLAAAGRLAGRP